MTRGLCTQGVLSDGCRLKFLVIVLYSRVSLAERSTRKSLGRRWHWVLRFRSVSGRRGRQQRGYSQELSSKGRNCLSLLLFYLVLGVEPGACV